MPAAPPHRRTPPRRVRVIDRALDLLLCFDEKHEKLTLQEMSRRTGIHKATAFRILTTLVEDGVLDQPEPGGSYALGFFALRRADALLGANALRQRALPIMRKLRDDLNETIVLAERRNNVVLNIDRMVSGHGLIEAPTIGVPTPLHETAAGLAILSTLSADDVQAYLSELAGRQSQDRLAAVRARIRHANASLADSATGSGQMPVLAAPILDESGRAIAALSVAMPSERAEPRVVRHCLSRLQRACQKLRPARRQ